jgi:hypothetical protein
MREPREMPPLAGPVAVATIAAKNYLSFARVAAGSCQRHHPDVPFFVALSDEPQGCFDPDGEPFHLLRLQDLPIPELHRFRFHYDRKQLAVAAKPYVLRHLLDRGYATVVFLDADTLVLEPIDSLFETAGRHAVTLVPHITAPLTGPDRAARELNNLQCGIFNGGCLAVHRSPAAMAFLDWWQARLFAHSLDDIPGGLYFDQHWLNWAPIFFDDVGIFRDQGYNVGHWNMPERAIRMVEGRALVGASHCRLFHFSGFEPDRPSRVTRYSMRLTLDDLGDASDLFTSYRALLDEAGYRETRRWPYAWSHFDNGETICDEARRRYRELGEANRRFGDPIETTPATSFYRWFQRHGR